MISFIRGYALGLFYTVAFIAALAVIAHAQQQTRTTCYKSGRDTICETRDQYGHVQQKTVCYPSGRETICDTRTGAGTR